MQLWKPMFRTGLIAISVAATSKADGYTFNFVNWLFRTKEDYYAIGPVISSGENPAPVRFATKSKIVEDRRFWIGDCDMKQIARVTIPNNAKVSVDGPEGESDSVTIEEIWKIEDSPLLGEIVLNNPRFVQCISEKKQTQYMWEDSVRNDPELYEKVPQRFRTYELKKIAIAGDGYNLRHIPIDERNHELCLLAMKQSRYVLWHIPLRWRTAEVCDAFLSHDHIGADFRWVPEELRTEVRCDIAISKEERMYSGSGCLEYVPEKFRTPERCRKAVKVNGENLGAVPEALLTEELVLQAIATDLYEVKDVLRFPVTIRILKAVVRRHPDFPKRIPADHLKALLNFSVCCDLVGINPYVIFSLPEDSLNEYIIIKAIRKKPELLKSIHPSKRTEEMYRVAIEEDPKLGQYFRISDKVQLDRHHEKDNRGVLGTVIGWFIRM